MLLVQVFVGAVFLGAGTVTPDRRVCLAFRWSPDEGGPPCPQGRNKLVRWWSWRLCLFSVVSLEDHRSFGNL